VEFSYKQSVCGWLEVEKNQAAASEWRRRRQQWSQHGRHVASVREDPVTGERSPPPPPARLHRSVDIELGGTTTTAAAAPATQRVPQQVPQPQPGRSLLGRVGTLSCRVLLLDGDDVTVQVEVKSIIGRESGFYEF